MKEGIILEAAEFQDNRDCIDLITKPPTGIIHLLDHENKSPEVEDKERNKEMNYQVTFV